MKYFLKNPDSEYVHYTCAGGLVLDTSTNRREIRFPCKNITNFNSPKKWPRCKKATHCVGPARKTGKR